VRSVVDRRALATSMASVVSLMVIVNVVAPHLSIRVLESEGLFWVSLLTLAYMAARATASITHAALYRVLSTRGLGTASLATIVGSYTLYAVSPPATYPAIKLVEGFAAGIFWPLMQTLIVDSVDPRWRSRWMSVYFIAGAVAGYSGYMVGSALYTYLGPARMIWAGVVAGAMFTVFFAVIAPGKAITVKGKASSGFKAVFTDLGRVWHYIPIILLVGGVNGLMKDYLFAYTKQITGMDEPTLRNYWSLAGYAGLALSYVLAHVQEVMGKTRVVLAISTALVASASLMAVASDPAAVFAVLTATTVGLRVIRPILRGVVANAASRPEHGIALVNAFSNIAAGTAPVIVALASALI